MLLWACKCEALKDTQLSRIMLRLVMISREGKIPVQEIRSAHERQELVVEL